MTLSLSVTAMMVIAVLSYVIYDPPSDGTGEGQREYYSGEPGDYYGLGLGPSYRTG